jgi:ornithine cyclodeaminase
MPEPIMSPTTTASTADRPSFRFNVIRGIDSRLRHYRVRRKKEVLSSFAMRVLSANDVAAALPYDRLITALEEAFAADVVAPPRKHHDIPVPGGHDATLLLMPAWMAGRSLGVKIATVFPDNAVRSLPAVFASYLLLDAGTGEPVAVLDGTELTVRRTAAASALASAYLSRDYSRRLLMVGTGNLAPHLVRAHATVRPLEEIVIWGRRPEAAAALAEVLAREALPVTTASDLDAAIGEADIISCATLATEPLVRGELLHAGQHLDLVGAFRPDMSEADVACVRRAEVYVDTRSGAFEEAGDIVQALDAGVIGKSHIRGELAELARGSVKGRTDDAAITLFKSVGTALEDLAAAALAIEMTR